MAYNGQAASSTDGITWTQKTMPSSNWNVSAFGNNKFVAIAYYSSDAAYSTDGITWTLSTLPAFGNWVQLTYANNTFVAVGQNSTTAVSSTDGITWTLTTSPVYNTSLTMTSGNLLSTIPATSGTLSINGSTGTNGQVLQSTGTGIQWGTVSSYSAPTLGSTPITSGGTFTTLPGVTSVNGATVPSSGTLATLAGTEILINKTLGATSTTTLSANTATAIDTVALNSFTAIKYIISIKQGTKIRASEILVTTDGTTVNYVEYGTMIIGTALTGFAIAVAVSSTNSALNITITDAATTNATIKLNKVVM
jgi:hypothetical protein